MFVHSRGYVALYIFVDTCRAIGYCIVDERLYGSDFFVYVQYAFFLGALDNFYTGSSVAADDR